MHEDKWNAVQLSYNVSLELTLLVERIYFTFQVILPVRYFKTQTLLQMYYFRFPDVSSNVSNVFTPIYYVMLFPSPEMYLIEGSHISL